MIKNQMARSVAMIVGAVFVMAVSGCAFSGPGTHPGGDGFNDVGASKPENANSAKPSAPDEGDDDLPVPR